MKTICYFIAFMLVSNICLGQYRSLNLSTINGLGTNHTYCLLVDTYGYLWIGSDHGVYRYNGYSLKKYDYADGLSNRDIWWLYQDSFKRIWLHTISDQLGYIYNNKFKPTINMSGAILYPQCETENQGYFSFLSFYNNKKGVTLCAGKNDTIFSYDLSQHSSGITIAHNHINIVTPTDSLYRLSYHFSDKMAVKLEMLYQIYIKGLAKSFSAATIIQFQDYFIGYLPGDSILHVIDLSNRTYKSIKFNCRIILLSRDKKNLHLISDTCLYELDTALHVKACRTLNLLTSNTNIKGNEVSNFIDDTLWDKCLSTKTNGIYINYKAKGNFQDVGDKLDGYKHVGEEKTISYWWNEKNRTLVSVSSNQIIKTYLAHITDFEKVIQYKDDSLFVIGSRHIYWYNKRSGRLTNVFINTNPSSDIHTSKAEPLGGFDGRICNHVNIYILSNTNGFYHIKKEDNKLKANILDYGRYKGMTYDTLGNSFWLYNHDNIIAYRQDTQKMFISPELLHNVGITIVEKLLSDGFGNIFLKTNDRLILIDRVHLKWCDLSGNAVLDNADDLIKNNILVTSGKFGIIFRHITGLGKVSKTIFYPNVKGVFYNIIEDMAVTNDYIILKTDKAIYKIGLPSVSDFMSPQQSEEQYRLIANSGEAFYDIKPNDTIQIDRHNPKIQFDLIKPTGIGSLQYYYTLSGKHSKHLETNSDNLFLPALKPGKYYQISVIVSDEVWKSAAIPIQLYIIPAWWQKKTAILWMWALASILVAFILALVVYATRKIVMNLNERKNARLQLELKAVYSQINPHFIFNTLGVAQYFASKNMMKETTNHISKFSSLLRAYLKSARNKFITVSEEIANIRNYVELQQLRFPGKFNYDIIIDPAIDAEHTQIPSLLLQPIVENAINHGLFYKKHSGYLKIEFRKSVNKNELICIIEDNGIGRTASKKISEKNGLSKESYGFDLISDLINIFKKYEQMEITIAYKDKEEPLTGTIVEINIRQNDIT